MQNVRQHIISHSMLFTLKKPCSSDLEFDVEIENFEKFTQHEVLKQNSQMIRITNIIH